MRDSLNEPIVLEKGEAADKEHDALDIASGTLIKELFNTITMPDLIKNQIIDRKKRRGETSSFYAKGLGSSSGSY